MTNQQHTQEPWSVNEWSQADSDISIGAIGTPLIAKVQLRDVSVNEQKANARRIVCCVNACVGIPSNELDEIAAEGGMLTPRQQIADIAKQRNELLVALKEAHKFIESITQANGPYIELDGFSIVGDAYRQAEAANAAINLRKRNHD